MGTKQKLMLVNGTPGAASRFELLIKLLSAEFEVYAINFSGHGGNKIMAEPFSFHLFARDIAAFPDKNNLKCTDIFVSGMDGWAAAWMARFLAERINKIITVTRFLKSWK